jgi:hypothetical protein
MASAKQRFGVRDTQTIIRQFVEAVIAKAYRVPYRKPPDFSGDLTQRGADRSFQK